MDMKTTTAAPTSRGASIDAAAFNEWMASRRMLEVQRALDHMTDSIDTGELGRIIEEQSHRLIFCSRCDSGPFKNLRALSAHGRTHR